MDDEDRGEMKVGDTLVTTNTFNRSQHSDQLAKTLSLKMKTSVGYEILKNMQISKR
jgi:hypothetical protein